MGGELNAETLLSVANSVHGSERNLEHSVTVRANSGDGNGPDPVENS